MKKIILLITVLSIMIGCKKNVIIKIKADYPVPASMSDLYESADYILEGTYGSFKKEWNMARDQDDINKESSFDRIIGKIYDFHVDMIIKGIVKNNTIPVNLEYSTRIYYNNQGMLDENEVKTTKDYTYIDHINVNYHEPQEHQKVILFLSYDTDFEVYYPAFYPFAYDMETETFLTQATSDLIDIASDNKRSVTIEENKIEVPEFMKNITRQQLESLREVQN